MGRTCLGEARKNNVFKEVWEQENIRKN
jgi:hypothetical protein